MKMKLFAMAIATVASTFAFAKDGKGFLFTPYVYYEMGTNAATLTAGTDAGAKSTAIPVGARIGYGWDKFWLAADVSMQMSGKEKADAGGSDYDMARTSMGLDLGWMFGKFGLWLNYGFSDSTKYSSSGSDTTFTGTSYGLGMSYALAAKVNLDLNYKLYSYKKIKDNSGNEADVSAAYSKYDASSIFLGFSFPLM